MRDQADKYIVRLPNGMRANIKRAAKNNRRSMNAEIVMCLDKFFGTQNEEGSVEAATSPSHSSNIPA